MQGDRRVDVGRIQPSHGVAACEHALDVSYAVEPSDALYTREGDTRGFVGIHVNFDVTMRIPNSAATYAFAISVEPPQTFTVSTSGYGPATDGQVYAEMAARAFDQLSTRLATAFFGAGAAGGAGVTNTAALPGGVPPKPL